MTDFYMKRNTWLKRNTGLKWVNPFHTTRAFPYSLKISENLRYQKKEDH